MKSYHELIESLIVRSAQLAVETPTTAWSYQLRQEIDRTKRELWDRADQIAMAVAFDIGRTQ